MVAGLHAGPDIWREQKIAPLKLSRSGCLEAFQATTYLFPQDAATIFCSSHSWVRGLITARKTLVMQQTLSTPRCLVSGRRLHASRPSRRRSCRGSATVAAASGAPAGAYANPVGVHALVFAGDWSEASATAAAKGARAAGYDLVRQPPPGTLPAHWRLQRPACSRVSITKAATCTVAASSACSLGPAPGTSTLMNCGIYCCPHCCS